MRSASLVWKKAWSDSTLVQVRKWLENDPSLDGLQIGERLAEAKGMGWSRASKGIFLVDEMRVANTAT